MAHKAHEQKARAKMSKWVGAPIAGEDPYDKREELPDPFNAAFSAALVAGTAEGMTPDCGHELCSTHCDNLIIRIRNRRAQGTAGSTLSR